MWLSAGLLWHFQRLFWWVKLKISVHQRWPEAGNSLQRLFTCTALCSWWGWKGWRSLYQAISLFTEEDVWDHRADLSLHLLLWSLSFFTSPNERKPSGILTKGDSQYVPCKDKSPFHPKPHPCLAKPSLNLVWIFLPRAPNLASYNF